MNLSRVLIIYFCVSSVLFLFSGCATLQNAESNKSYGERIKEHQGSLNVSKRSVPSESSQFAGIEPGERVLKTGYKMAFEDKKVICGSCWDFVDAVYYSAGFPEEKRYEVFKGKTEGPYADVNLLKPGDWVMHINLEFGNVEHSDIFVKWADRGSNIALVLDYAGMNRMETGKERKHDLSKIFGIVRPSEIGKK